MRKIFAHCFLSEIQKKYLEKNFALNVHNANEKILSPDELVAHASGYDGIICQGNIVSKEYIKKNCNILKVISNVSVVTSCLKFDNFSPHFFLLFGHTHKFLRPVFK